MRTFSFLLSTFRCAHILFFTFDRQNVKRPTSRSNGPRPSQTAHIRVKRPTSLHTNSPLDTHSVHGIHRGLPMCAHFHFYFQPSKRQTAHVQGQRNMWWAAQHVVGSATCGGQRNMWWAARHPQCETLSFSHSLILSHIDTRSVYGIHQGRGKLVASHVPRASV